MSISCVFYLSTNFQWFAENYLTQMCQKDFDVAIEILEALQHVCF
jgi:hypothetical protein